MNTTAKTRTACLVRVGQAVLVWLIKDCVRGLSSESDQRLCNGSLYSLADQRMCKGSLVRVWLIKDCVRGLSTEFGWLKDCVKGLYRVWLIKDCVRGLSTEFGWLKDCVKGLQVFGWVRLKVGVLFLCLFLLFCVFVFVFELFFSFFWRKTLRLQPSVVVKTFQTWLSESCFKRINENIRSLSPREAVR